MNVEVEVDKHDPVVEAEKLQQVFEELLAAISLSLGGVDLNNLKVRISYFFNVERHITTEIQAILDELQSKTTPSDVLNFLITRNFIGYLNYELLNTFQKAGNSHVMKAKIEEYEKKHNEFLRQFSLNAIANAFKQYPNLAPVSVVGLPKLTITLNDMWEGKSAYKWKECLQKMLTSSSYLTIVRITRNCIVLTYAVLPLFISSVVKDLEDPLLLEIKDMSVEPSSDLLKLGKQDYEDVAKKKLLSSGNLSQQPSINHLCIFIHLSNYVYYHPLKLSIYVSILFIPYYHTVHRGTAES